MSERYVEQIMPITNAARARVRAAIQRNGQPRFPARVWGANGPPPRGQGGRNRVVTNELVTSAKPAQAAALLRTRAGQLTAGQTRLLMSKLEGPAQASSALRKKLPRQRALAVGSAIANNPLSSKQHLRQSRISPTPDERAKHHREFIANCSPGDQLAPKPYTELDRPNRRYVVVRVSTDAIQATIDAYEKFVVTFRPWRIGAPLTLNQSTTDGTAGSVVTAFETDYTGATVDAADMDGLVASANWITADPYTPFCSSTAVKNAGTGTVQVPNEANGAATPVIQILSSHIEVNATVPYADTAVFNVYNSGMAPNVHDHDSPQYTGNTTDASFQTPHQFLQTGDQNFETLASRFRTPTVVSGASGGVFTATIHGLPWQRWARAGHLDATDGAPGAGSSLNNSLMPKSRLADCMSGFFFGQAGATSGTRITARACAVVAIQIGASQDENTAPFLSNVIRTLGRPLHLNRPIAVAIPPPFVGHTQQEKENYQRELLRRSGVRQTGSSNVWASHPVLHEVWDEFKSGLEMVGAGSAVTAITKAVSGSTPWQLAKAAWQGVAGGGARAVAEDALMLL